MKNILKVRKFSIFSHDLRHFQRVSSYSLISRFTGHSWPKLSMISTSCIQCAKNDRNSENQELDDSEQQTLHQYSNPKTLEQAVNNILYNTPSPNSHTKQKGHIISCLVTNEPGVLSKISGILASRGFNIDSVVACRTDVLELSRMTIVLKAEKSVVEQAKKQLDDIVPVWAVLDYSNLPLIERELLLARVSVTSDTQRQILVSLVKLFDGRVVDLALKSMTIELSAKKKRVDAFLALLKPYGLVEVVRSGIMAMPRAPLDTSATSGKKRSSDMALPEEDPSVNLTDLPPG